MGKHGSSHIRLSLRLTIITWLCLALVTPPAALAQSPNLLFNPSFEGEFVVMPGHDNIRTAAGWTPAWRVGSPEEVSQGYRLAPEYKAAFRHDYPGNRVRSGELAQQFFHSWGNFEGWIYQQVSNIAVGSKLRFETWVMSWSCDRVEKGNCEGATSGDPSPMRLRIGIDPTGGLDPFNPAVAWSPYENAYDSWHHLAVEAVAQSSRVTVFVYAYPEYRSQNNDVYVDDASLIVVAPPPTATPRPTNTPTATPPPTNTPLPTATPTATETPLPTATLEPTHTPEPTLTLLPTATPTRTATRAPASTETLAATRAFPTLVIATPAPIAVRTPTPLPPVDSGRPPREAGLAVAGLAAATLLFLVGLVLGRRMGKRP
jgi:hypothetical protein